MKYGISVQSPLGTHNFQVNAHERMTTDQLALDSHDFYLKHARRFPSTPHFEIEVLTPDPYALSESGVPVLLSGSTETRFIPYPRSVPTFTNMWEVFTHWCLISKMILDGNFDLEDFTLPEHQDDSITLISLTKKGTECGSALISASSQRRV